MIVALGGGIGASKLLLGVCQVIDPSELTVIVNTGDDFLLHGLTICPDLDTVAYTLAGFSDQERGWGIEGDSFNALSWLDRYGREAWFNLGDRDLATHLHRTALLRQGLTLAEVTDLVRRSLGVRTRILPMANERISTIVIPTKGRDRSRSTSSAMARVMPCEGSSSRARSDRGPRPGFLRRSRWPMGSSSAPAIR
jgi:LPPG:FO 2-phospho-L-lactate transferase